MLGLVTPKVVMMVLHMLVILPMERDAIISYEAERWSVPVGLALAVTRGESPNPWDDSTAVSPAGAIGYMQVMPMHELAWLSDCYGMTPADSSGHYVLRLTPLTNRRRNACVGVKLMALYFERYGGWNMALRAYNGAANYRISGDTYIAYIAGKYELTHHYDSTPYLQIGGIDR